MATLSQLQTAYQKAVAAGREDDIKVLSGALRKMEVLQDGVSNPIPRQEEDDAGFFENVGTGLASGAVGMLSTAALGAATLLEEESELKARKKIKSFQEALTPDGGDKDSVTYKLSQGVGSIASLLPTAFLGPVGGLAAAGTISGAAGAGEASERARAYGATEEERNIAAAKGVGVGLTELIPLGRITNKLRVPGLSDAIDKLAGKVDSETIKGIGNRLTRMAGTGATEGVQEASAAILQNLVEQGYNPEQVMFETGVLEEGAVGAGSGAIIQALADVLSRKARASSIDDSDVSPEEAAAQREFDERQDDAREGRDDIQADLFADELNVAEQAERERQGPVKPDTKEKTPEPARDTSTRDMIDELETADINRLEAQDKVDRTRKLDEARDTKQKETTETNRRKILNSVVEKTDSQDPTLLTARFRAALVKEGYRDSAPTKAERESIQTYDFKRGTSKPQQVTEAAKQKQFDDRQRGARKERDTEQMDMFPAEMRDEMNKLNTLSSDSNLSTLEARIKEKLPNARKQTARTPDTKAARDSVPSSAGVVGDKRTEGAEKPRGAVEGRLDDSVSDTGRPDGRERQPTTALTQQELELPAPRKRGAVKKPASLTVAPEEPKGVTTPTQNEDTKKISYTASKTLVPEHKKLGQDRQKLAAIDTLNANRRIKDEALERRMPADLKEVAIYVQKFDTPMDAILNAVYDVATPNRTTLKDSGVTAKGLNSKKSAAVLLWAKNNLSQDTNKAIRAAVKRVRQEEVAKTAPKPKAKVTTKKTTVTKAEPKAKAAPKAKPSLRVVKKAPVKKAPAKKSEDKTETEQGDISKGKTFTAYHRTTAEPFAEFNETHLDKKSKHSYAGAEGIYFSPKSNDESTIAFGANEAEVELTINNPVPIKTFTSSFDNKKTTRAVIDITTEQDMPKMHLDDVYFEQDGELRVYNFEKKPMQKRLLKEGKLFIAFDPERIHLVPRMAMKKAGYDGIIVPEGLDIPAQIVILEPKQAKVKSFTHLPTKEDITPAKPKTEAEPKAKAEPKTKEEVLADEKRVVDAATREFKISKEDAKVLLRIVSKETTKLLDEGKLREALLSVSKSAESKELRTIARTFSNLLGNTKIEYRTPKDTMKAYPLAYGKEKDVPLAYYDYKTDTVYLMEGFNTTNHMLLHEVAHALTEVAIERSPNAAAVRQLKQLFEDIKEDLGTAYGRKDIHEFIAEGLTNRLFRKRLGQIVLDDKKQFSALDKFLNAVMNIIRMLQGDASRQLGSALQEVDQLGLAILEPNLDPTFRYVRTDDASVRAMAKSVTDRITEARAGVADTKSGFSKFWEDYKAKGSSLKALAKAIHIATLGDIARSNGFGDLGHKLHEMIDKQRGAIDESTKRVDAAKERQNKFAKDVGEKAFATFNRLIYNTNYGATIFDVDPFADKGTYKGKFRESVNLDEVHAQQKEQLRKLTTTERTKLKEQYYYERNLYKEIFNDLAKSMEIEANDLIASGDKESGKKLLKNLNEQLLTRAKIENYWPLVREGEFRIFFEYVNRDPETGEQIGVENALLNFEHVSERDAMVEILKGEADVDTSTIAPFNGELKKATYQKAPTGAFISNILNVLDKNKVDSAVKETVIRMYASTTPESSFLRSLVRRKGDYGYIQNVSVALANKGHALAVQAAKIQGTAKIQTVANKILKKGNSLNTPAAAAIADVLVNDHAKFAMMGAKDKGMEKLYKEANQVAFLYTLGFNVSSAVVNLSQIPLFVVPYLAPRFGLDTTIDEFMSVGKLVGGARMSVIEFYDIDGKGEGSTYTLKKSVIADIKKHAVDEKDANVRIQELEAIIPVVKEANLRGKLFTTNMTRELGLEEKASFRDKLSQFSAYFFVQGERFNTQTTIIASYNLIRRDMAERRKAGKKYFSVRQGKEIEVPENVNELRKIATEDALYTSQETNGGATLETTMPYAKQGIGRVALMYKSFGVMMNSSMIKSALIGTKQLFANNPEQRKQALKQLAGIHLSAMLFAGVGGIPIWGIVSMLWDLALDDDEDDADTILRKYVGEGFYKGPLSTITGMDVSQRIKLNDLIFQENRFMRDPSVEESIGYYLGGPFLSTVKRFDRAMDDMVDGEFWRMTEAMLPAGASNLMTSLRFYSDEGVASRRGDFIYEDISGGEVFSKALGFAPLNYTFNTEKSARDNKVKRSIGEQKKKLSQRYYRALRFKDYGEAQEVWKEIQAFNKEHPLTPLSRETILKSLKGQNRTTASMHNGVAVSPTYRLALEKSWKEYSR